MSTGRNSTKYHIVKQSYKDHCIGEIVEYPDVIAFGKTDKELEKNLMANLRVYKQAMDKGKIKHAGPRREVLEIEGRMGKRA